MTNVQRQRATGVLFVVLAILIAVSAVLNFQQGAAGTAGAKIIATGFLGYLAWRQLQPRQDMTIPTSDERTIGEAQTAASTAFWLLICLLLAESYLGQIPSNLETSVYLIAGMIFLALAWGYQKIINR